MAILLKRWYIPFFNIIKALVASACILTLFGCNKQAVKRISFGNISLADTNTIYNIFVEKMPAVLKIEILSDTGLTYDEVRSLSFDIKFINTHRETVLSTVSGNADFCIFSSDTNSVYRVYIFEEHANSDILPYNESCNLRLRVHKTINRSKSHESIVELGALYLHPTI